MGNLSEPIARLLAMKPPNLRPWLPTSALKRRPALRRPYAIQSPGAPTLQIFNENVKYLQKERAASNHEHSRKTDYLKDEVAQRLVDRAPRRCTSCPRGPYHTNHIAYSRDTTL